MIAMVYKLHKKTHKQQYKYDLISSHAPRTHSYKIVKSI